MSTSCTQVVTSAMDIQNDKDNDLAEHSEMENSDADSILSLVLSPSDPVNPCVSCSSILMEKDGVFSGLASLFQPRRDDDNSNDDDDADVSFKTPEKAPRSSGPNTPVTEPMDRSSGGISPFWLGDTTATDLTLLDTPFEASRHSDGSTADEKSISMVSKADEEDIPDEQAVARKLDFTAPTGIPDTTLVYSPDAVHGWLPAVILDHQCCPDNEANKESDIKRVFVAIDLPPDWSKSTLVPQVEKKTSRSGRHQKEPSCMHGVNPQVITDLCEHNGVLEENLRCVNNSDLRVQNVELVTPGENTQIKSVNKRDLMDLFHLHEPAILFNLKERHLQQQPYTRVNEDILLSVNPCQWNLERPLYTVAIQKQYTERLVWNRPDKANRLNDVHRWNRLGLEPHIYEISCEAYMQLKEEGIDQTILVTGESGAGKTETVKFMLKHLAWIGQNQNTEEAKSTSDMSSDSTVDRVCESSPVFEAFGNARTIRNDNSSRFGKLFQLQFRRQGTKLPTLVGSHCTSYLLEKSRVTSHAPKERSYHIFYQLLSSSEQFLSSLWPEFEKSLTIKDFRYLQPSEDCDAVTDSDAKVDAAQDKKCWGETKRALAIFGYEGDSLLELMRALTILLQLGNLEFKSTTKSADWTFTEHNTHVVSTEELQRLSAMTQLPAKELQKTLTCQRLRTGLDEEEFSVRVSTQTAKQWSAALAKEIYSRVFTSIVKRINQYTMAESHYYSGYISLLDIFGFESFEVNRFEQLCINFANEKLHQKYVVDNFTKIKEEYDAEGIDLYDFSMVDNSRVLDLFDCTHGILALLSEECHLLTGQKDASFVGKVYSYHANKTSSFVQRKLHQSSQFGVQHFAGTVTYTATHFIDRNMDTIPDALLTCAHKMQNGLIAELFSEPVGRRDSNIPGQRVVKRKDRFVLDKFKIQLTELISAMHGTHTRYVRCIKPNTLGLPRVMGHRYVLHQLECSGVATAIKMTREAYPNRQTYAFLINRYSCLLRLSDGNLIIRDPDIQNKVTDILNSLIRDNYGEKPFACGKTKVYFKAGIQDCLETLRLECLDRHATHIQASVRSYATKKRFQATKASVLMIQSHVRAMNARQLLRRTKYGITQLQGCVRRLIAMKQFASFLQRHIAASKIQIYYRPYAERHRRKRAALLLQSCYRLHLERQRQMQREEAAALRIQSCWRRHHMRVKSQRRKNSLAVASKSLSGTSDRSSTPKSGWLSFMACGGLACCDCPN